MSTKTSSRKRYKPYSLPEESPIHQRKTKLAHIIQNHTDFFKQLRISQTPYDLEKLFRLEKHADGSESLTLIQPTPPPALPPSAHAKPGDVSSFDDKEAPTHPLPPGITAETVAHPLLINKMEVLGEPPDRWAQEFNHRMEEAGLGYLPKAPFVLFIVAPINMGKTNLLCYLLNAWIHIGRMQNVTLCSQSALRDPLLTRVLNDAPPQGVKVTLQTESPLDKILADAHKVEQMMLPKLAAAAVSRFSRRKLTKHEELFCEASSIHHPYVNRYGDPISHRPIFPAQMFLQSPPSNHVFPQRRRKQWASLTPANLTKTLEEPGEHFIDPELPPALRLAAWNMNPRRAASLVYEETVQSFPRQQVHLREEPFEGRITVVDDAMGEFTGVNKNRWAEFSTRLRHFRQCLVIAIQKLKGLNPTMRAQVTHLILYPVRNAKEREDIIEEYGGTIPFFKEIWDYCCTPTPTLPRPFMYLSFTNAHRPLIMKCFSERIHIDLAAVLSASE